MNEVTLHLDTPYFLEPGQFCKPRRFRDGRYEAGRWESCRELFNSEFRTGSIFFYSHITGKTRAVSEFMAKVEEKLNVDPRSNFGPTQRKTVCWIEPSNWWTKMAMRRSLFTILLRVGQQYKPHDDNFEEALYSHHYSGETRYAVERFFDGHTVYTGNKRGWYNQFSGNKGKVTTEIIDRLLVKNISN